MMILNPLLWLICFTLACWGLGLGLIKQLNYKQPFANPGFFLPYTLGTGIVILMSFLLLLSGSMNLANVLMILALGSFLAFKNLIKDPPVFKLQHLWLLSLVLVAFIPGFSRVFSPEHGADALSYHLPYAKFLMAHQTLAVNEYLRYPLNALNYDLLFVVAYILDGEILAKMFHAMAALAVAIGLFEWGSRTKQTWTGLLAAFIWLNSTVVMRLASSAYIDLGLTMFLFAAAHPLLTAPKDSNKMTPHFSAVLLGVGTGIKYLGLFFLPLYSLMMGLHYRSFKKAVQYFALALMVGSPWYLYNIWVSGNPVHPFLQEILGYWLWTAEDMMGQKNDLLIKHGVDRTWLNFIKLPLLFAQDTFNKHGGISPLLTLGFAMTPVMLFYKKYRLLACLVFVNLMLWFFTSQILRYLLPVFPFVAMFSAVCISMTINWFINKWPHTFNSNKQTKILIYCSVLVFILSVAYLQKNIRKKIRHDQLATSPLEWQEILNQNPDYQLVQAANNNKSKGTFKLGFVYTNHYANHPIMGDWFGKANMKNITKNTSDLNQVVDELQRFDADHLLIDLTFPVFKRFDDVISKAKNFQLIFQNSKGRLYQLKNSKALKDEKSKLDLATDTDNMQQLPQ